MMFKEKTAWFSSSVDEKSKQLWSEHGGKEVDFDTAAFIFSSDSTCADTEKVYQTDAYISEHLAVFHPRYIQDCVDSDDRSKVALGRYFLPPYDILAMVKKQMTLCWDAPLPCLKPLSSGHTHAQSTDRPGSGKVCPGSSSPPKRNMSTVAAPAINEHASVSTDRITNKNNRCSEITSSNIADICEAGPSTSDLNPVCRTGRLQRRKITKAVVPIARNTTDQKLLATAGNSETDRIPVSSGKANGSSWDQSGKKMREQASHVVPHSPAKQRRGDNQHPEIQQTPPLETSDSRLQSGRTVASGEMVMETEQHHQAKMTEKSNMSQQNSTKSADYVSSFRGCLSHFEQGDSADLLQANDEHSRHWKQNPVEITVTFKRQAQTTLDTQAEKINTSVMKHGDSIPVSSDICDIKMLPRVKISEISAFIPGKNGSKVFKKLL